MEGYWEGEIWRGIGGEVFETDILGNTGRESVVRIFGMLSESISFSLLALRSVLAERSLSNRGKGQGFLMGAARGFCPCEYTPHVCPSWLLPY